jgi:hypothetical protein
MVKLPQQGFENTIILQGKDTGSLIFQAMKFLESVVKIAEIEKELVGLKTALKKLKFRVGNPTNSKITVHLTTDDNERFVSKQSSFEIGNKILEGEGGIFSLLKDIAPTGNFFGSKCHKPFEYGFLTRDDEEAINKSFISYRMFNIPAHCKDIVPKESVSNQVINEVEYGYTE